MTATKKIAVTAMLLAPVNFLLFGVKLWVGLASGSIAVYSDGVNNFFDGLSLAVTAAALLWTLKRDAGVPGGAAGRTETLFTFLLSLVIAGTGAYFVYNALERLMYPTPVFFTPTYFVLLIVSIFVKAALFFIVRRVRRTLPSELLKAVGTDSLLDALITTMTAGTLLLSYFGSVSLDAVFGLVIGTMITVSAVRQIAKSGRDLTDAVPTDKRQAVYELLTSAGTAPASLRFLRSGETITCVAAFDAPPTDANTLQKEAYDKTGVTLLIASAPKKED